ncbi:hypothetical protein HYW41_05080 [Candidatus Daviesbacteria bacterium]|nr:hypothetical protein [Candidatus Daviesbacteria bacterium]
MRIRLQDRILAREYRKQGFSFSEIMAKIPHLSKSTLNGWLKDIELTQQQKVRLFEKIKNGPSKSRFKGALANHQKRIDITRYIVNTAREETKSMINNSLFILGTMLYWAEGDKCQERVGFTNSDPMMILLMMKWFREICGVSESKFRIFLAIMTLHDENGSKIFWSRITNIPLSQFNKIRIKQTPLKGKRNPSYMGTCRIVVSDKNLFRKIMGWKLGILENYNISAPIA